MMVKDPCHVGQRLKASQEQLARLEDDFKSKLTEEAILQVEYDRLRLETENAEEDAREAVRLAASLKEKIATMLKERGGVRK